MKIIKDYNVKQDTYFAIDASNGQLALVKKISLPDNSIARISTPDMYEGIRYVFPDRRNNNKYFNSYYKPDVFDNSFSILCPSLVGSHIKCGCETADYQQLLCIAKRSYRNYLAAHKSYIRKYQNLVFNEYKSNLSEENMLYNNKKYLSDYRDYQNIMWNLDNLIKEADEYDEKYKRDLIMHNIIAQEKFKNKTAYMQIEKVSS